VETELMAEPGDIAMSLLHRSAPAVAPLQFVLPFPPSVNRYYRHVGYRTLLSREGREYRSSVLSLLAGRVQQPLSGPLQAELHLYPPDRRRRDWDNFQKGIWDSLQHAGVYLDDSQVKRAIIEMHEPEGKARAECLLTALDPPGGVSPDMNATTGPDSSPIRGPGTGGAAKSSRRAKTICRPANSSITGG
jgi:crossover junction endodeoxyribonuclease RusA